MKIYWFKRDDVGGFWEGIYRKRLGFGIGKFFIGIDWWGDERCDKPEGWE